MCEVVLREPAALHVADDRLIPRRARHESRRANPAHAEARRHGDAPPSIGVALIPVGKGVRVLRREGAHVRDLNADRARVGSRRVPGALLRIKRLVNRAVEIEHELHAQAADVVQNLEALPARARRVEVDDELIHHLLQQRQVPAAAADALDLLRGQLAFAQAVAGGRGEILHLLLRSFPIRFLERREPPLHAISVVTAGVQPQHDRCAGVDELAGHDDFITRALGDFAGTMDGPAAGADDEQRQRQRHSAMENFEEAVHGKTLATIRHDGKVVKPAP